MRIRERGIGGEWEQKKKINSRAIENDGKGDMFIGLNWNGGIN